MSDRLRVRRKVYFFELDTSALRSHLKFLLAPFLNLGLYVLLLEKEISKLFAPYSFRK